MTSCRNHLCIPYIPRKGAPLYRRLFAIALLAVSTASGAAEAAANTNWWSPFADPVLDTVMQAAAPPDAAAEQAVVQRYIAVRVGEVRSMLAAKFAQAASHQQAVLMNAPADEQRQAGLQTLARRIETIESTAASIDAAFNDSVGALAQSSGMAPFHLRALLNASYAGGAPLTLPAVQAQPPDVASVSVLRNDIAERLQLLSAEAKQVDRIAQVVETRKVELDAHLKRQQLGADEELGTLEVYQQFIVDSDALAQASGRLGSAWAQWLQSGGVKRSQTASAL